MNGFKFKYLTIFSIFFLIFLIYNYGCFKDDFKTVSVEEFEKIIKEDNVSILDVRTSSEYKSGHIEKSINIDVYNKEFIKKCGEKLKKDNKIAIYCQAGSRSKKGARLLKKEGYDVVNLDGGIENWISNKKNIVK